MLESKFKSHVEEVFADEINAIRDPEIAKFVVDVFRRLMPDYFMTCPASTSGKYHPEISLGEGGLVRHVKLAVWWGVELAKPFGITADLADEVTAALLLHDLIKNGRGLNDKGFSIDKDATACHGVWLAQKIRDDATLYGNTPAQIRITSAIAGHMGIWTSEQFKHLAPNAIKDAKIRLVAWIVHLADYAASRKVDEMYRKLLN